MPIAKDDGAAVAPKNVDDEIRSLLGGYGAAPTPAANPVQEALANYGPSQPNFNPAADISAGRVTDILPGLGAAVTSGYPGRGPLVQKQTQQGVTDLLGLAAVTEQRQEQVQQQKAELEEERRASMTPAAVRQMTKPPRPDYTAKPMDSLRERLSDVGMYSGALTVLPEIENAEQTGSTGVPAWDARIEEALNPGRGAPQEPSFGAGARAGSSLRIEAPDSDTEIDLSKDRAKHDRMVQNKALGGRQKRTDALTSEEYEALTPKQRAAVDLNTLLVTAVREDLAARKGKKANPNAGGKAYDAQVAEVFGEKGAAAAPYAPRTMELLDNVDFNVEGSNLDDVLKLKVGLNAEDIADLNREQQGGPDLSLDTSMKRRDDLTDALVSSFRQTRRDPQRGAALLETQRDLLNTREAIDFGNPQTNQMIDGVFEMLANPNSEIPADKLMAEVKATLSEPDWQTFIRYLDLRSTEAQQYGRPLGVDPEVDYMGARRFRRRFEL